MKKQTKERECDDTMIIKLWDHEKYDYPMIEIYREDYEEFIKDLKNYQKHDTYNFDDYLDKIEKKQYFIRTISYDAKVFF